MDRLLDSLLEGSQARALVVVAAPAEGCAVLRAFGREEGLCQVRWRRHGLRERLDLLIAGVGKANAAGAVMRVLEPSRDRVVVSCGIAGSLPGSGCGVRDAVVATRSVYGDEGIETDEGFATCQAMGFRLGHGDGAYDAMGVACDAELGEVLGKLSEHEGVVATVSTCAGTDVRAREVVARTGAIVEAMEGAAIGVSLGNMAVANEAMGSIRFGEYRVVSNTAGDRSWQRWDIAGALGVLGSRVGRL